MKRLIRCFLLMLSISLLFVGDFVTPVHADDAPVAMWRLYNPNSGEHFYTSSTSERDHLYDVGWDIEGVGWYAPVNGQNVYRLYNANGGEHHYTTDSKEKDILVSRGWSYEGIGWKSGGSIVLKREYNPNAFSCNHNYTTSVEEHNHLVSLGWKDEGNAWNAVAEGNSEGARKHTAARVSSGPFVVTRSGKKYHQPTCGTIKGRKILHTYNTAQEAEAAGYNPCSDCIH